MLQDFQCRVLSAFAVLAPMLGSAQNADMQYLLDRHNLFRCMHGVPPLTWDATVAQSAQDWANGATTFGHAGSSSQYYSYGNACGCGENAAGMGTTDPKGAADMWYSEYTNYNQWDLNHFTAMIWRDVSYLGCGVRVGGPAWSGALVICRYKQKTGTGPNVGGGAQAQVSLTIVKSMNACTQVVQGLDPNTNAHSSSSDDDDGPCCGLTTTEFIVIVAGAVWALCCFFLVIFGLMRRRRRHSQEPRLVEKQPEEPMHTEVTPEAFTDVRQAAIAEKDEVPENNDQDKVDDKIVSDSMKDDSLKIQPVTPMPKDDDGSPEDGYVLMVMGGVSGNSIYLSADANNSTVGLSSREDGTWKKRWTIVQGTGDWFNIKLFDGVSGEPVFLSAKADCVTVDLSTQDDGTGKQRWTITKGIGDWFYVQTFNGDFRSDVFLGAKADGSRIELVTSDMGTGRQQWKCPGLILPKAPKTPQTKQIVPATPIALSEDEAVQKLQENDQQSIIPTMESARGSGKCLCTCDST